MSAASWLCFLTFVAGARVEQMIFPEPEFEDLEADEIETSDDQADDGRSSDR